MKPLPKGLLIGGLILCFGAPMVGLLFTVIGMIGAFQDLGQSGISNPQVLSTHIGEVLTATMAGLMVGVGLGLPLFIAGLVVHFATKPAILPPPAPIR